MFIEHVNLTVSDLPRSIDFYRDLFGFEVRWQGTTSNGAPAAHVGDERSYVALFQGKNGSRGDTDYERVGFNHFGLVVDDLAAAKRRLQQLGIEPSMEADYEPGRRLYFHDPDGIEVELVEYDAAAGGS
jgi:catechol 2,3-dioxygenase-like lactoylglutathione lyase family enzyme